MAVSSTYQSNASEAPIIRKWILRGLIASLAIHLALYAFFRITTIERFSTQAPTRLAPRQFTVQQLQVDETLLDQQDRSAAEPDQKENTIPRIPLPEEADVFQKEIDLIRATPTAPDLPKPIPSERPKIDPTSMDRLAKLQSDSEASMQAELDSVRESLIRDAPTIAAGGQLQLPIGSDITAGGVEGYSDLDSLLAQSGGLKKGTAPILLPTDLLYDYNSAVLRPDAMTSLMKLGQLITKNPNVIFTIEGHADSFGSAEYNMMLSEERAETVKRWLVAEMGLDPRRIGTKGYGSTALKASATGTVEEQQINRRVEIVMEFP